MPTDNNTESAVERHEIDPVFKEVMTMAGKLSLYEKHLKRIAESLGEDLLPFLSEEVVKRIPPENRVRGLTAEDIVRSLSPETKEKLLQLLHQQDGKQN